MTTLSVLHFNDTYRVTPQKVDGGTIDVSQFAALVDSLKQAWQQPGLVFFSGDLFSPSVESTVTRGSHMVPVMNEIGPDVALAGNHDFDFGYPHFSKLIQDCRFPWLLTNIIDTDTGRVPAHLKEYQIFERSGIKIGVIGLVEKEWIETVSAWPPNFEWRNMEETAKKLSQVLRDPEGEHKCDLVFALTHCRLPNDIALARALSARASPEVANEHGVDVIFGGHDHFYFVSKGVEWTGWEDDGVLGAEDDDGVFVVKSGTDFRELSETNLEIVDAPEGSIRRKLVTKVKGKRHAVVPNSPSSEKLSALLKTLLSSITHSLDVPVCKTSTVLDLRSELIRTREAAAPNWFADVIRPSFDDALCIKCNGGADGVLICGGTLRGDSTYGPGCVTLGNILEVLPFQDPCVVLELPGEAIWDALESGLETWPAQEGRFPVVSGFRVEWDSRRPPGQRVLSVRLQERNGDDSDDEDADDHGLHEVKRDNSRTYRVVTREYMASGKDGYVALTGRKYLIDEESGLIMSTVVRRFLLGSQYIKTMKSLAGADRPSHLLSKTEKAIARAHGESSQTGKRWKDIATRALKQSRKRVEDALAVGAGEHMQDVDCFDGPRARSGDKPEKVGVHENDLITISPVVDGRFRDVARE